MESSFSLLLNNEEEVQVEGKKSTSAKEQSETDCLITQSGTDQLNVMVRNFSFASLRSFACFLDSPSASELDTILIDLTQCSGGQLQVVCDWLHLLSAGSCQYHFSTMFQGQELRFESTEFLQEASNLNESCELVLKIGPGTFSSGVIFAHLFQQNQLGKIYGSSTGGSPSCTGNPEAFDLPYSRLRLHLACTQIIAYESDGRPLLANQSIHPDVFINITGDLY